MSHISLSGDRLEIKVLIIHSGLLPGNRPPLAELLCWLERSKDETKMVEEERNSKVSRNLKLPLKEMQLIK